MRNLVLIIMVIAFIIGGGSSSTLNLSLKARTKNINYEELADAKKKMNTLEKEGIDLTKSPDPELQKKLEVLKNSPAKWKITVAGLLGILLGIVSLFMVINAFMKKEIVKKTSIAVVGLSLLLWILTPSIAAGKYSGANPKSIALVAFIGLLIAAGCAFLSYNMYLKNKD